MLGSRTEMEGGSGRARRRRPERDGTDASRGVAEFLQDLV
jgi:hypothetical protein